MNTCPIAPQDANSRISFVTDGCRDRNASADCSSPAEDVFTPSRPPSGDCAMNGDESKYADVNAVDTRFMALIIWLPLYGAKELLI